MADMNISGDNHHKGKVRMKKANLRVDLTPMVDLAFLLISFFMLTTTLMKQKSIALTAPDTTHPPEPASECQILNLLTDAAGQVYYWEGIECHAVIPIALTGEHTLKTKIKEKSTYLKSNCLPKSGKPKELICLIKLLPGSRYEHMIRILDEVASDSVPVYTIQNYSDDEVKAVQAEQQKLAMR